MARFRVYLDVLDVCRLSDRLFPLLAAHSGSYGPFSLNSLPMRRAARRTRRETAQTDKSLFIYPAHNFGYARLAADHPTARLVLFLCPLATPHARGLPDVQTSNSLFRGSRRGFPFGDPPGRQIVFLPGLTGDGPFYVELHTTEDAPLFLRLDTATTSPLYLNLDMDTATSSPLYVQPPETISVSSFHLMPCAGCLMPRLRPRPFRPHSPNTSICPFSDSPSLSTRTRYTPDL